MEGINYSCDNLSEWYKYIREWGEKITLELDPAVYEKESERVREGDRKMKRYKKLPFARWQRPINPLWSTQEPTIRTSFHWGWILNKIQAYVAIPAFAKPIDEDPSPDLTWSQDILRWGGTRTYKMEEKESRLESDRELYPAVYKREKERKIKKFS